MTHTAYWWDKRPNFGDKLTQLLMAHFADVELDWAPAATADCVVVGSVLESLPPDWAGIVAGAGKLHEGSRIYLPDADIYSLRGPLTAAGIPGDYALGDPGMLASELVENVDKQYHLGIVPHWSDTELENRHEFRNFDPHIIRPDGDPLDVIREIGRCRKIVSSSLHGVIVADSFGIPRRTEIASRFASEGGTFKFRDYNASINVEFEVGRTQEAPRYLIQDRQNEIFDVLEAVGYALGRLR